MEAVGINVGYLITQILGIFILLAMIYGIYYVVKRLKQRDTDNNED
jgi:uncharacterized membrane protein